VVEDAAHAFPAAWRRGPDEAWQQCGQQTAAVSCFSFYANKTITTGEGGMAVCDDLELADVMRSLSLHGLSQDSWERYSTKAKAKASWDYRILAPGYKYNMTDIAAAIGIHQLARAEAMRQTRETIALEFRERLADIEAIELPVTDANRIHAWHLFPIRLRLDALAIDRNQFIQDLNQEGVSCSVHWRPLHLHPYYEQTFGWRPEDLPVASEVWTRLISLPLFSAMRREEIDAVVNGVRTVCGRASRALASKL
jgi:dTDP-4-amino-4,6-dideoxygalactose transaminase